MFTLLSQRNRVREVERERKQHRLFLAFRTSQPHAMQNKRKSEATTNTKLLLEFHSEANTQTERERDWERLSKAPYFG